MQKILKFIAVCTLCVLIVIGLVFLIEWIF